MTLLMCLVRASAEGQAPSPDVKEVQDLAAALKDEQGWSLFNVSSQIESKLDARNAESIRLADAVLGLRRDVVEDAETLEALEGLAGTGRSPLAAKLFLQVARARRVIKGRPGAAVVVGQLVVADGKADPTLVLAQMAILEDGYFATEVGDLKKPLCFRSDGYRDLDVPMLGTPGSVQYLGRVTLRALGKDETTSVKGRVSPDAAAQAEGATVRISVAMGPINTTSGGFSGRARWPESRSVAVAKTGQFAAEGMNPGKNVVTVGAPGHVEQMKHVTFEAGKPNDLGVHRLFSADLGFYLPGAKPTAGPLAWEKDFETALQRAQAEKKPLFVMMTATWCGPCKALEDKTLADPWVREFLSPFVVVKAYEDREVERKYGLNGYPTLVFIDPSGKAAHKCVGYMPTSQFASECAKALGALKLERPRELQTLVEKGIIRVE